mmetsp:Transcript_86951/g.173603  ORF Transcript_86951/g.173603 Transcript_86951/m.173603 type:complete len:250 (+) Transcript_86951:1192-1941(+)
MVIGGVAREPPIKVGPREEVNGVLLGTDSAVDDLGVEVVVQLLLQARLDRERFVEELAVECLLGLVDEDDRDPLVVKLRPASTAHHLEHVSHREVDVALLLAIVKLCALDDDEVGGEVDAPCEGRGAHEHHDGLLHEELLDGGAIALGKPSVVDAHAEGKRVPEGRVLDRRKQGLEVRRPHVDKLLLLLVGRAECNQIERRQPRLPPTGNKDEDRLLRRVGDYGPVGGLVHRCHPRAVVFARESCNVHL